MTLHDSVAPRKHSRRGLYIPFLLLAVVIVAWTAAWFWLKGEAERRMDAGAAALREGGYTVSWSDRKLGGYPFRLDADFTDFRMAEPSGWGIAAPTLKAEAYIYALNHWVAYAPTGVTLNRPIGGPLLIDGQALRASVAGMDNDVPRLAVEGANLTFTPAPGAQDYLLQSAERLNVAVRPGPDDQGAVLLNVTGAKAHLPGLLARVAADKPVDMDLEVILSKMSAFAGPNWRSMAQSWVASGGEAQVRKASLVAGGAELVAHGDRLTVGPDGRVQGKLDVDLRKAGDALSDMSGGAIPPEAGFGGATLTFSNGETTLGPLHIAPAPRLF
ncbi:MAG: DUF2125 domain-containing protein [Ignavibacteriales bacterium]